MKYYILYILLGATLLCHAKQGQEERIDTTLNLGNVVVTGKIGRAHV